MEFLSAFLDNSDSVNKDDLIYEYGKLLIEGETVDINFKILRDILIFTNKRILLIDKKGITGTKVEYFSINYKNVSRFSIESNGTFESDGELKIWITGESVPAIKIQINKSVDIYEIQRKLAAYILG